MALLITQPVLGDSTEWREAVLELMPDLEVRLWPDIGELLDGGCARRTCANGSTRSCAVVSA